MMQKKLIALAVAGMASTGVFAQMNVTVFGTLDVNVMNSSGTSSGTQGGAAVRTGVGIDNINAANETARGSVTTMGSGNTRSTNIVGFKGTEDLGGGLTIGFDVYSTITMDGGATGQAAPIASVTSAAGLFGNRESALTLSGGFGALRFGRMSFQPNDTYGDFEASGDKLGNMNDLNFNPLSSRVNNSIQYSTPNLGGFVGMYQVAMSENQDKVGATPAGTVTGLMLRYNAGPVAALLSQTIGRDYATGAVAAQIPSLVAANPATVGSLTGAGKSITINRMGASYDFGVAKLMGAYMTTVNTTAGTEVAKTIDANTWSLSTLIPMGAHLFRVEYVSTNDKRTNDADASSWFLGYDYALSKRTSAYLGAIAVRNTNGAMFSANADTTAAMTGVARGSQAAGSTVTSAQGGRTNAYYAGLLHTF